MPRPSVNGMRPKDYGSATHGHRPGPAARRGTRSRPRARHARGFRRDLDNACQVPCDRLRRCQRCASSTGPAMQRVHPTRGGRGLPSRRLAGGREPHPFPRLYIEGTFFPGGGTRRPHPVFSTPNAPSDVPKDAGRVTTPVFHRLVSGRRTNAGAVVLPVDLRECWRALWAL